MKFVAGIKISKMIVEQLNCPIGLGLFVGGIFVGFMKCAV
jgi:hypothetical protein